MLETVEGEFGGSANGALSRITWQAETANIDSYEIWRSVNGFGNPDTDPRWESAPPTNDPGADHHAIVNHQRPFYYSVRASNQDGTSDWSNVLARDYPDDPEHDVVMVSATGNYVGGVASITLSWPERLDPVNETYNIYRKLRTETSWQDVAIGLTGVTSWTDTDVLKGEMHEYRVIGFNGFTDLGFVFAGVEATLDDARGTVLLVIDKTQAPELTTELAQLERDLIGDGWRVVRMDADPTLDPQSIKAGIIQASNEYGDLGSVFLFGDIAVPRSGTGSPDGHAFRALPADGFYGDLDGTWTDSIDHDTNVTHPKLRNLAGDGNFDQGSNPTGSIDPSNQPELAIGRVDMSDFTIFPNQSETDLLRQYLTKLHDFRYAAMDVQRRGFIDDHFYNNCTF